MRVRTVDDAEDPPEQEDHDERGRLVTLRHFGQSVEEHDIQHERRNHDQRVEYLHNIHTHTPDTHQPTLTHTLTHTYIHILFQQPRERTQNKHM